MKYFVNIKTVFPTINRDIEQLKEVYKDKNRLISLIDKVIDNRLNNTDIADKRILIKPNWVRHSKIKEDEWCLRTHDNFLLATLEYMLRLKPKEVMIGDAPIQGCHWSKMVTSELKNAIEKLSKKYDIPVEIKDFRRVHFDRELNNAIEQKEPLEDYVIFDVGKKSYLEPITEKGKNNFRVTVYNPDRFKESHRPGVHKYCISKELFDADVVISLPKVKTHQKAGITAALKNIVGLNGDKDFLPHHRVGGTDFGGDCYPGGSKLRYWSELSLDNANRNKGKWLYSIWIKVTSLLWRLSLPKKVHSLAAGWYGNDTTWRMVMDLNQIIYFGNKNGKLSDKRQRLFFSLCDGIIGGQGDGPLKPEQLPLGVLSFTNTSSWNDLVLSQIMGMESEKIPLLVSAKSFEKDAKIEFNLNGDFVNYKDFSKLAIQAEMPPGWTNYNNI